MGRTFAQIAYTRRQNFCNCRITWLRIKQRGVVLGVAFGDVKDFVLGVGAADYDGFDAGVDD